jgi:hypothetical protein
MSAIDDRTVDPAKPHPSENLGHEMSDFSWTTVLWLLPISVVALIAFTLVSLYWFRGAKDTQIVDKQSQFSVAELNLLRTKESEYLNGYKVLNKESGRVRIPIQVAMDLVVKESQGKGTVDYLPITDIYLQGKAFGRHMAKEFEPQSTTGAKGDALQPRGAAAEPAMNASQYPKEASGPGGGALPGKAEADKAAKALGTKAAEPTSGGTKQKPEDDKNKELKTTEQQAH